MIRIYHSKLSKDKELYFNGEKLYKKVKNSYKEIKKSTRNTFIVYNIEFNFNKLLYLYKFNVTEESDKVDCFYIKTYLGEFILNSIDIRNLGTLHKTSKEKIDIKEFNKYDFRRIPNTIYFINEYGKIVAIDGTIMKFYTNKYLSCDYDITSYRSKYILNGEYYVHRIVARIFLPDGYKENLVVNHKDGNKKNNHYLNLEWCTSSENLKHAYDNNLKKKKLGEDNVKSKLKEEDVIEICKLLLYERKSCKEISKIYNIDDSSITDIKNKKTWTHLECVKNLPEFSKRLMKFLKEEDELMISLIKKGYTNKEVFNKLPEELKNVIKMSPIIETRTKINKGLL